MTVGFLRPAAAAEAVRTPTPRRPVKKIPPPAAAAARRREQ